MTIPLHSFIPGQQGTVVSIRVDDLRLIHRLTSLGLYPGVTVTLLQHRPTAIVRVGETDVALESSLTRQIDCNPLPEKE
jgi:Fe2+ transport system protein FeoA